MSSEAFADQRALSFRNRQPILIGDDAIPERADVANFVFRRKVIETRRRNWESVCHVERIASDRGSDNRTKRQPFRRPPNVAPLSSGRIRKRGGIRWRRASPWYFTTGSRQAVTHEEARPSASTACWAAWSRCGRRAGRDEPAWVDELS